MEIAQFCRWGLVLGAAFMAAGSYPAFGQSHDTAPAVATAGSQSCENIPSPSDQSRSCKVPCGPCDQRPPCGIYDYPDPVGGVEGASLRDYVSPFGVELSQSQGFSAVMDSGPDGLGSLPGGCSSCGEGGSIPAASQMMRFELPRIWRSTWTHDGNLGRAMYTGYDYYVTYSATSIEIRDPNTGFVERFINSGGTYIPAPGVKYRTQVTESTSTHVTFVQPGGLTLRFEVTGYAPGGADQRCRLQYVQDRNGNQIVFSYALPATNTTANVLMWSSAADPYGRSTTFSYTTFGGLNVLDTVTLADGRTVKYLYTTDNNQFPHVVQYGVGGVPSGIQSTWYVGATAKMDETLCRPDPLLLANHVLHRGLRPRAELPAVRRQLRLRPQRHHGRRHHHDHDLEAERGSGNHPLADEAN